MLRSLNLFYSHPVTLAYIFCYWDAKIHKNPIVYCYSVNSVDEYFICITFTVYLRYLTIRSTANRNSRSSSFVARKCYYRLVSNKISNNLSLRI